MVHITSPEEFFGFKLGSDYKMARWDKIVEYFNLLNDASDCIQVTNMGPSTEGNPFLQVIITSAKNFENLEGIRQTSLKIADPRGLSQQEINALVEKGKAVCVQSMSLHASEIGGTQMAPQLAYDLITKDDQDTQRILDQVVFVMVPCFNPDGQLMLTDWYYKNLGTESEGCQFPKLYHKYTGHDNNRDAFAQNIIESVYMGKILFHDWMPQAYQDHHHMGSYGARLFIAPYKNPLRPHHDPILWRELNWYGANMAYQLESEGLDGVTSGAQFPAWGHYGYHWITNSHNIAGMLTESANAKLATPLYIDKSSLRGDGDNFQPEYEAQTNFPSPWQGGWWRIGDVVARQYTAAYALLDTMARNREAVLKNMTIKALNQTKRGEESDVYAYIIPKKQYDKGAYQKLIKILLDQGIELKTATAPFTIGNATYETGTIVVFLAQPKLAVVMNLLGETHYPDNIWTRNKDGALSAFDVAADTVAEYMGVDVFPANAKFEGSFEILSTVPTNEFPSVSTQQGYVLSAQENDSYMAANKLMKAGLKVYRINACPYRDFYVEGDDQLIQEILKEVGCTFRTSQRYDGLTELKPLKVAMYERYYAGNAEEGWNRLVFERYGFDSTPVLDADIIGGKLKEFDVLIIPSDETEMLHGPKYDPTNPKNAGTLSYCGNQPADYQSGLGDAGSAAIKEFVQNGGKLIAVNHACDYAIEKLGLRVKNVVKGLPFEQFNTHGSTLKVQIDTQNPIGYAMPEKALILHWNGPVFEVMDKFNADQYDMVARFEKENILKSGLLVGEKLISQKGAIVTAKYGQGHVVLYGFAPMMRAQTHGTFKLMFNALYE